jgi:hypothetical protein
MRIIYDVRYDDTQQTRLDAIILSSTTEFQKVTDSSPSRYAFRGDTRLPSHIFNCGFTKRHATTTVYGLEKDADDRNNAKTLERLITRPLWGQRRGLDLSDADVPDYFWEDDWQSRIRMQQHILTPDEVMFRPHHMDLVPETCVSTTTEFEVAAYFPLPKAGGGTLKSYIYLVKLPERVLWTYEVQKAARRLKLCQGFEVTCNEIPAENVIGAAEVEKWAVGTGVGASQTWKVTDYWGRYGCPYFGTGSGWGQKGLTEQVQKWMKMSVPLEKQNVSLSTNKEAPEGSGESSNQILKLAIEAVRKHTDHVMDRQAIKQALTLNPIGKGRPGGDAASATGGQTKGGRPRTGSMGSTG